MLKSRGQKQRDTARGVLVSMARLLGPRSLGMVVDALVGACPPRGYTAHVLGFTLHAVLEGLLADGAPGPNGPAAYVDESLGMLLPLVEADLFTDLAEEKEASPSSPPASSLPPPSLALLLRCTVASGVGAVIEAVRSWGCRPPTSQRRTRRQRSAARTTRSTCCVSPSPFRRARSCCCRRSAAA